MAEFGSVVTEIGANLERLDKDLLEATKKLKRFYDDASKMAIQVHAGGVRVVGGGGGSGGGGGRPSTVGRLHDVAGPIMDAAARTAGGQSAQQAFEIVRIARNRDEEEARRSLARQSRAEDENARKAVSIMVTRNRSVENEEARNERYRKEIAQRKKEDDDLELKRIAAREAAERSQRQFGGVQSRAEAENEARKQAALKAEYAEIKRGDQARIADDKTIANFEKAALDQQMGELRAKNTLIQVSGKEAIANLEKERALQLEAGKEFAQIGRQTIRQGGTEALAKARLADKERTEELKRSADAAQRLSQHVDAFKQGLQDSLGWAKQIAPFLGAGLAAGIGAAVTEAFNLNRELQLQRLTLAADLELTTKIVDAHGRYVGLQKELQINLAQTPAMLKQIRQEAEKTTLTEQELRTVVTRNLAPALRAGKGSTPTSAIDMISQLANAARVFGAGNENQVSSEVRGVLNASPLVRRSILGGALGISPKELKDAQEAGTLFEMLQKRLALIQPLLDQANVTFDHLFSTLISKGKDFLQLALQDVFQKITGKILDLNKAFSDEKVDQMARQFADTLDRWYDRLQAIGQSSGFKAIQKFFTFLVENYTSIIAVFAAWKLAQAAAGSYSVLNGISSAASVLARKGAGAAEAAEGAAAPFAGALAAAMPTFMAAVGGLAGIAAVVVPVALAAAATYAVGQAFVAPLASWLGDKFSGAKPPPEMVARQQQRRPGFIGPLTPFTGAEREQAREKAETPEERLLEHNIGTMESRIAGRHHALAAAQENVTQQRFSLGGDVGGANKELQTQKQRLGQEEQMFRNMQTRLQALQRESHSKQEKAEKENLRRIARTFGDEEAAKKKHHADLQVWLRRLLAKGTEDEKEQNRLRYEADARSVYDKLGLTKQANQVVAQLHQQLVDKDADIDERNAEAQRKFLADLKDDKLAALKEEYQEHLDTIKGMTLTDAEDHQDRLAALQAYQRARADQIKEWTDKERDLAQQSIDEKAALQKKEVEMVKELLDLKTNAAREARAFAREEVDAQHDLQRAQIDRKAAQERLFGTPERRLPPGVFGMVRDRPGDPLSPSVLGPGGVIPAQAGMLDEQQSILKAAQRLFGGNVGGLIQGQLQSRQPGLSAPLAQAQAQAQVRSLIEAAQREGGAQEVTGRLRQMGVGVTPEFTGQLQSIETRTLNLQGRQQAADQADQAEQVRRQKEDADRQVTEAQRRIADLADREAKARRDYEGGLKRIQAEYKLQISDATNTLVKFADELRKLTRELAASGMNLAPQFRAVLTPFLHMTRGQAQGEAAHALAPVYHITFGPGSLQVKDLSAAELKRAVSELLQREARNAAPARR